MPYEISHAAGSNTVYVNQSLKASGGKWNLLGTYSFDAGSAGYVEVSSINGQACADAIRLVPVSAAAEFEAQEIAAAPPGELTVNALKMSIKFERKTGATRLKATAAELPKNFNPAGVEIAVDVCGATVTFTLDKRGRARGSNGTISAKNSKTGWTFSASLKNLTWPGEWSEAGIEDWTSYKGEVSVPVSITAGAEFFTGAHALQFKPTAMGSAGK